MLTYRGARAVHPVTEELPDLVEREAQAGERLGRIVGAAVKAQLAHQDRLGQLERSGLLAQLVNISLER